MRLRLKKNEERRLLQGHLWIYSNEVDVQQTPLTNFIPGSPVVIEDSRGRSVGCGYVNPHTLLCARLLSRNSAEDINENFFITRVQSALRLRQALFSKPFYRLIYGESDYLPGLIVDRYGDLLVVQITTAGIERLRDIVIGALEKVISPSAILLRNDHSTRALEGLPEYVEPVYGQLLPYYPIEENDVSFFISPSTGQKTGWFYDHRENRRQLQRLAPGRRVLDVFSYVGAWGVQAAVYGASEVWAIDSSKAALEKCAENARLNQVDSLVKTLQGDAFDLLKQLLEEQEKFDIIILDPPAFIKKRKDFKQGFLAYQKLNSLALQLLSAEGFLITASCSHHLSMQDLEEAVQTSSINAKRNVQLIAKGHQGFDHPVHPAIPETSYLKALFYRTTNISGVLVR